jgi:diketogulonate reductase-like aldo/keto reductase
VSKVWTTYNTRVELGLDKSLKSLGLDYVDLFLVVRCVLQGLGVWSLRSGKS